MDKRKNSAFGLAPKFLLELSPFHGSIYFTSMGSLGIKPVYHHLYDFGTVPAFCAFGRKRRAEEIKDGEVVERKYMDLRWFLLRSRDKIFFATAGAPGGAGHKTGNRRTGYSVTGVGLPKKSPPWATLHKEVMPEKER